MLITSEIVRNFYITGDGTLLVELDKKFFGNLF